MDVELTKAEATFLRYLFYYGVSPSALAHDWEFIRPDLPLPDAVGLVEKLGSTKADHDD